MWNNNVETKAWVSIITIEEDTLKEDLNNRDINNQVIWLMEVYATKALISTERKHSNKDTSKDTTATPNNNQTPAPKILM